MSEPWGPGLKITGTYTKWLASYSCAPDQEVSSSESSDDDSNDEDVDDDINSNVLDVNSNR